MEKFLGLILIFLVLACSRPEKPDFDILSHEKMAGMLIDIHINESLVNAQNMNADSSKAVYRKLEENIFEKHQVERAHFEKSYDFYMKNIHELDAIYQVVVDSLSLREAMGKIE